MRVTFEQLEAPVLEDTFYGMRIFVHTKVWVQGHHLLDITMYEEDHPLEEPEDEDDCFEELEPRRLGRQAAAITYGVRTWDKFPALKPVWATELKTVQEAQALAESVAKDLGDLALKLAEVFKLAEKKYKFRYGVLKWMTVTVKAGNEPVARARARDEVIKRGRSANFLILESVRVV